MDTRKRPRSYSEEANDRPAKTVKEEVIAAGPDGLAAAQARIIELENQMKGYQDFLECIRLGRGNSGTSISSMSKEKAKMLWTFQKTLGITWAMAPEL